MACLLVLAGRGQAWLPLLGGQREGLGKGCKSKETAWVLFAPAVTKNGALRMQLLVLRGISSISSLIIPSFVASVSK